MLGKYKRYLPNIAFYTKEIIAVIFVCEMKISKCFHKRVNSIVSFNLCASTESHLKIRTSWLNTSNLSSKLESPNLSLLFIFHFKLVFHNLKKIQFDGLQGLNIFLQKIF